jgi:hypothetical protein
MSKTKIKTMVIILFDFQGVFQKEFAPPGVTVNQKYYLEVLGLLRKRAMRVRMEIADDWILRVSSQQRPRTQHCQFVNFWRKIAFPYFRWLLNLQICHIVIFAGFKN